MLASEGASRGNFAGEVRGGDVFRAPCHMLEECWEEILISITQTYSQLMALISSTFFSFGWNFEGTVKHTGVKLCMYAFYNMHEHINVLYSCLLFGLLVILASFCLPLSSNLPTTTYSLVLRHCTKTRGSCCLHETLKQKQKKKTHMYTWTFLAKVPGIIRLCDMHLKRTVHPKMTIMS